MKKISIIIPVFNAEDYLYQGIEKLMSIKYEELEIILVNDGSTDNTASILSELSDKDSRMKVISVENGGPSSARNIGLRACQGEYVFFFDSDDFIETAIFEKAIQLIQYEDSDFYMFSYTIIDKKKSIIKQHRKDIKYSADSKDIVTELIVRDMFNSLWSKAYRFDIMQRNCLTFDEDIRIGEDLIFNLKYLSKCESFYTSKINYYFYDARNNNSLIRQYDEGRFSKFISLHNKVDHLLSELSDKHVIDYLIYTEIYAVLSDFNSSNCLYEFSMKVKVLNEIKDNYIGKIISRFGFKFFVWTFIYTVLPSKIIIWALFNQNDVE